MMFSCKEAARLVSQGLDRELGFSRARSAARPPRDLRRLHQLQQPGGVPAQGDGQACRAISQNLTAARAAARRSAAGRATGRPIAGARPCRRSRRYRAEPVCAEAASSSSLKNEPSEVFVPGQVGQPRVDVGGVDRHRLRRRACAASKRDLLEQPLHHRVQAARADVLGALVHLRRRSRRGGGSPSGVKSSVTPSVASSAWYCLIRQASVLVRMRSKSSTDSESSSTRIGKRPCSSGIRSRRLAPGGTRPRR